LRLLISWPVNCNEEAKLRHSGRWRGRLLGGAFALILAFPAATHAQARQAAREAAQDAAAEPVESALALATFDSAWTRIRNLHFDSTFGGLDWNAVRAELRPRAAQVRTTGELRKLLSEMIGRVGVSHYSLIPLEYSDSFDPRRPGGPQEGSVADAGLELRAVGDDVVVWRVTPDGAAAAAGVKPGDVVLDIDGFAPATGLQNRRSLATPHEQQLALTRLLYGVNRLVQGIVGDSVTVRLRAGGQERSVTLALRPTAGQLVKFGNLPPSMVTVRQTVIAGGGAGDGCVGVISFTSWMAPIAGAIDKAVDAVRHCEGMIIDLRGNPGGVGGMVMGVGGHFVDSVKPLGTMKMRNNELKFVLNPRRVDPQGQPVAVYDGPLAILVDAMSASTSEIFAAGMQAIGRARVFGELSAGQALPALASKLPNGDVLMHAIADYLVADGTRIEGRGVVPDEVVPLTVEALSAGRDAALQAAVAWIGY
jgi:carboxyl-terminal processing protease